MNHLSIKMNLTQRLSWCCFHANNFKVYLLALCYFCIFIFCLPKPHQQLSQYNGKKTGRKGLGISNFTRPGLGLCGDFSASGVKMLPKSIELWMQKSAVRIWFKLQSGNFIFQYDDDLKAYLIEKHTVEWIHGLASPEPRSSIIDLVWGHLDREQNKRQPTFKEELWMSFKRVQDMLTNKDGQPIHSFTSAYPYQSHRGAIANPSYHKVRGRAHSGQVAELRHRDRQPFTLSFTQFTITN